MVAPLFGQLTIAMISYRVSVNHIFIQNCESRSKYQNNIDIKP
jgi:hypothetical protein